MITFLLYFVRLKPYILHQRSPLFNKIQGTGSARGLTLNGQIVKGNQLFYLILFRLRLVLSLQGVQRFKNIFDTALLIHNTISLLM